MLITEERQMRANKLTSLGCVLLLTSTAQATVPLATGGGFLRVEAGEPASAFPVASADTTTVMLDKELLAGSRSGLSLSNLNIIYGTSVFADTQVSTRQVNEIATTSDFVRGTSSGFLSFNSRMFFQSAPPFASDRYPVLMFMPYSMTDFGTTDSTASVTMRVLENGIKVFDETRTLGVDPAESQFVVPGQLQPDDLFEIQIEAAVSASAKDLEKANVIKFSEAQAIIGQNTYSFPPLQRPGEPCPRLQHSPH